MSATLCRSTTDKMVAGVCGGLARWLDIDATLVRIFFALLAILTVIGFALYLVLWVVLPYEGAGRAGEADTARSGGAEVAQQARMMGDDLRDSVNRPNPGAGVIIGAVLILVGGIALLRNLDLQWLSWLRLDLLWPLLLIVGGAVLIWRRAGGTRAG
jgi:phage shock protein C